MLCLPTSPLSVTPQPEQPSGDGCALATSGPAGSAGETIPEHEALSTGRWGPPTRLSLINHTQIDTASPAARAATNAGQRALAPAGVLKRRHDLASLDIDAGD